MADRPGSEQRQHQHQQNPLTPLPRRRRLASRLARFVGVRELLLGAVAVGMVLGVSWADDRFVCEHLEDHENYQNQVAERDAALASFSDARCTELGCERVEVVSRKGCRAKLRVQAPRIDEYGDELGTFITIEGLSYSPLLQRWRVRETLDDTQILGLPVP